MNQLPLVYALTGDWTHNLGISPHWELNQLPLTLRMMPNQNNWATPVRARPPSIVSEANCSLLNGLSVGTVEIHWLMCVLWLVFFLFLFFSSFFFFFFSFFVCSDPKFPCRFPLYYLVSKWFFLIPFYPLIPQRWFFFGDCHLLSLTPFL